MAAVVFEFRSRGAARVQRDMQRVIDSARAGAAMLGRLNTGLATTAQQAQQAQRNQLLGIGALQRAARGAEREHTGAAREGSRSRVRVAHDEARERSRELMRWAEGVERAERRATAASEREAARRGRSAVREREARARAGAASGGRMGERIAGGAMQFGGAAHGMIQDARQRAALVERQAGLAFYQAGARSPQEIAARVAQTRRFAAANGMSTEELLAGANAAQTEFSSLQGATPEERQRRFTQALNTMLLARNTGNDPGEMVRLQGMLAQTGFGEDLQRQTLLYTAGASQQGAVEAGSLTREAMGSIMRRMQDAMTALGETATNDQRQQAAATAFRETVAELQVFRGRGNRVGISGNATAALQEALRGTSRQDKLLNNINVARNSTTDAQRQQRLDQLRAQLFEADPTRGNGAQRLRANMQNPLALAATYAGVMGNDATGLLNLVAGGGHGNAQSMQANWRNLLSQLVASDAEGVTGYQRVQRLMGNDVALTEERVGQGAGIFANDSLSQLNRENESRDAALTDNTSALNRVSNALAGWAAKNPLLAPLAGAAGGGILQQAGSRVGSLLGGARGAAQGALGMAGRGASFLGGTLGAGAGFLSSLLRPGNEGQGYFDDAAAIRAQRGGASAGEATALAQRGSQREFLQGIQNAVRDGARQGVAQSPQAAAQAAGVARTQAAAAGGRT